ncbi:bifunctional succinylornithine transaminase/acetylornithine transaminase, partial [Salmonella enterica subsp. enterica serovar Newport str. WA_14881]
YNDLNSASALIDDNTCAVIVEPVQGEGGVIPATKAFCRGCVNCATGIRRY